jgi:hypothetical protein
MNISIILFHGEDIYDFKHKVTTSNIFEPDILCPKYILFIPGILVGSVLLIVLVFYVVFLFVLFVFVPRIVHNVVCVSGLSIRDCSFCSL